MRLTWFLLSAIGFSSPTMAAGADANAMPMMEGGYRSTFADYRPYRQTEMADWREANDMTVGMGGHAGHGGHNMSHGDMHEGHDMKNMPDHSGHGDH